MAGISDKAIKSNYVENKYRFQKQELQNKEFSDGSGLEMYEFKYRFDDCQIGKFWSIDPLADKYVYNSTYAFSENKVTGHVELEGLESVPVNELNPYVRALLKDNITKDNDTYKEHASKALEVKATVGLGIGPSAQLAGIGFTGYIDGPSVEGKLSGSGQIEGTFSVAGAGGKAETPFGAVKGGVNMGVVQFKDGKIDNKGNTFGVGSSIGKVDEIKSDKVSANTGSDIASTAIAVGAKFGIVGLQVSVDVVSAGKAVVDFFKTIVDYSKNLIKEKQPVISKPIFRQ